MIITIMSRPRDTPRRDFYEFHNTRQLSDQWTASAVGRRLTRALKRVMSSVDLRASCVVRCTTIASQSVLRASHYHC